MRIYVADGLRHRVLTGYGSLARHLIIGLSDRGHEVVINAGGKPWADVERGAAERIGALRSEKGPPAGTDVVLQICSPGRCRHYPLPSAIYTQNALGGLRREWVRALEAADSCIVPSEFDRTVFGAHLPNVSVAPQGSNPSVFKPVPRWRREGSDRFTFLYVGSYGFRKGVDVLLSAFLSEFDEREPVELWLCSPRTGDYFNHLLHTIQATRPLANVRLSTSLLSPPWMCRYYNRADCVVTASRGEGWCMPLTEGLLCEKPVIAPDSTAPGEYLSEETAYLVPVSERAVTETSDPFCDDGFRRKYGERGITYFEPDVDGLRSAMRAVFSDPDEARQRAQAGREMVVERYDWRSATSGVEDALLRLVAQDGVAAVT